LRVLLCGYHEAGYRALRTLIARRHEILVATHEAPPELPSVAALARACGVTVVTDGEDLEGAARVFAPDIVFSVYYRRVLQPELLARPRLGAFNLHPSLLPKHRGCFSAPWAIIEGDNETGVTCHAMTGEIDAGDIVDVASIPIGPRETGISLFYRLADAAVGLFDRVLDGVEAGSVRTRPQRGEPTYHPRRVPFDGLIDPRWPRDQIDRFIRAMFFPPHPPAAVMIDGDRVPVVSMNEWERLLPAKALTHCVAPPSRR